MFNTMSSFFVSGLINIETTVQVEGFPIAYTPVRYPFFGVRSTVSGVGYNLTKALTTLGNTVRFASLIGRDALGTLVQQQLDAEGLPAAHVLVQLDSTPQSAILYDPSGQRMINTDLKDIQEQPYPLALFERAIDGCAMAVLCNINFSRPMLAQARARRIPIATDVHTISDLDDAYNRDFMAAADILFMSHERLPCAPEIWVQQLQARYGTPIIVVGLGAAGALLGVRAHGFLERFPAVQVRPVVNTIGAGDALFAAFIDGYARSHNPYEALRRAITFAAYKIGAVGAAEGFLDAPALDALYTRSTP